LKSIIGVYIGIASGHSMTVIAAEIFEALAVG
jgi:hypothetical protein